MKNNPKDALVGAINSSTGLAINCATKAGKAAAKAIFANIVTCKAHNDANGTTAVDHGNDSKDKDNYNDGENDGDDNNDGVNNAREDGKSNNTDALPCE